MFKWISGASGAVLTLAAVLAFWGSYGWITRQAYAIDEQAEVDTHKGQASQASIDALTTMIGSVIENQKKNQDEWKCDEAVESVIDLQIAISVARSQRETLTLEQELKGVELDMIDWKCNRFEN